MGPAAAAAIPAALGAVGSLIGGESQNAASAREARRQREWSERMSSTAWQRGVADMRAAGLNPMLAFQEGPASSPGGALADVPANPMRDASSHVSTALQARLMQQQLRNMEQERLTSEDRGNLYRQQGLTEAARRTFEYDNPALTGDTWARRFREANLAALNASAASARTQADFNQQRSDVWRLPGILSNTAREGWRLMGQWWNNQPVTPR